MLNCKFIILTVDRNQKTEADKKRAAIKAAATKMRG